MRKEYRLLSSRSGGLNETYKTIEELKERYNFIKTNKKQFKENSMIYAYVNYYNENDKIKNWKTLGIIDCKEEV